MAVVIAAILTPFILIIIMLCSLMSGMASHNNVAVDYTFNGGILPITMPAEYKTYITEMRSCFSSLDSAIAAVESEMEDGDSLDSIRVKAVFYALYFGSDSLRLRSAAARDFVECFVTYLSTHKDVHRFSAALCQIQERRHNCHDYREKTSSIFRKESMRLTENFPKSQMKRSFGFPQNSC